MTPYEASTVRRAIRILERRAAYAGDVTLTSPEAAKELAFLQLGHLPDEHFACAFLDNRHALIAFERLFRGTVDGASVHPRVVVRRALELNAAAVIFFHFVPRNRMIVLCPVFLCAPRRRSGYLRWDSDGALGT